MNARKPRQSGMRAAKRLFHSAIALVTAVAIATTPISAAGTFSPASAYAASETPSTSTSTPKEATTRNTTTSQSAEKSTEAAPKASEAAAPVATGNPASEPKSSDKPSPKASAVSTTGSTSAAHGTSSPTAQNSPEAAKTPAKSATSGTQSAPSASPAAQSTSAATSTGKTSGKPSQETAPPKAASPLASTNTSTTSAISGNGTVQGSQAQTTLANSQMSGIVTGGGNGSTVAQNSNSATINDSGKASGQTGLAAAQGAPASASVGASRPVQNGSTTSAKSGDASATGLSARNNLTNSTTAGIAVGGANSANISVSSSNQVAVTDAGNANVATGAALAKGGAATLSTGSSFQAFASGGTTLGPTVTPVSTATGLSPVSTAVSANGLAVANTASGDVESTIPNGSSAAGPLNVNQMEYVAGSSSGIAIGRSNGTCAGANCQGLASATPAPSPVAGGALTNQNVMIQNQSTTLATSGDAVAQGLSAQNTVNTSANVGIHIAGNNFGIINVAIQTVTQIVNQGAATATSGLASAMGANASAALPSGSAGSNSLPTSTMSNAASGNASTTGAVVSNQINLGSSTIIRVNGDNHNPIHVLVQLFAVLFNHGAAGAYSGGAMATGSPSNFNGSATANGGVSNSSTTAATSGSASATGLVVQNVVNLWSNVYVDITGSNYAPIDVNIVLGTYVYNDGVAEADSGPAQAYGSPSTVGLGGATTSPSTSSNTPTSSSSTASAASGTISGATGGLINNSSTVARSGSGAASGNTTTVLSANQQFSGASGSTGLRAALNASSLQVSSQSQASMTTGSAYIGPLPTPAPQSGKGAYAGAKTNGSPAANSNSYDPSQRTTGGNTTSVFDPAGSQGGIAPSGHYVRPTLTMSTGVKMTFRSYLPEPSLPMMPRQYLRQGSGGGYPYGRTVASQSAPAIGQSDVSLTWNPDGEPEPLQAPGLALFPRPRQPNTSLSNRREPIAIGDPGKDTNLPIADMAIRLIIAMLVAAAIASSAVWRRRVRLTTLMEIAVSRAPWH